MAEQQEDTQVAQYTLDQETANDIADLIKDVKREVKTQALAILLQCSDSAENRILFETTDIIQSLVKNLGDAGLTTMSLSTLINFTQDNVFQKHLIDQKCVARLVDLVKSTVKEVLESNTGKKSLMGQEHLEYTENEKLICDLCFLLLSNMTQHEEGKRGILQLEDAQHEGFNFRILYELYLRDSIQDLTHFFSNILTNISSDIDTRKYLVRPENELPEKCLKYIFHKSHAKRNAILKAFRNCMFEYDQKEYIARLFSDKVEFMNKATQYLVEFLCACNHLNENSWEKNYLEDVKRDLGIDKIEPHFTLDSSKVTRVMEIEELTVALDLFITLTNVDFNEINPNYNQKALQSTITYLSTLKLGSEISEKVEVMQMVY